MKAISTVTPVLLALFLAVACGDDDDSTSGGNTGGSGSGGAGGAGTGTQCKSPYEDKTAAMLKAATTASGKCAADTAAICGNAMITITSMCGVQCLAKDTQAEQLSCTKSCILTNATPAPSGDCADCYVADVACSIQFCLTQCAAGQNATCEACRRSSGCTDAFYTCSGLPQTKGLGNAGAPGEEGGASNGGAGNSGGATVGGAGGAGPGPAAGAPNSGGGVPGASGGGGAGGA